MSILLFLLVLFVLVLVHEFGHFITAKWSGMRVDEFGIGFPPKVVSFKKGETEYTLNALPIGGFVRIYGENGEDAATADTPRAFSHRPRILQVIVLIAGVTMNILFAWFLYTVTYMTGVVTLVPEAERSAATSLVITSVLEKSVAENAGLFPGDTILSLVSPSSDTPDLLPSSVSDFIGSHGDEELTLTYSRRSVEYAQTLTPRSMEIAGEETRPRVGFTMGLVETKTYPFIPAVTEGAKDTYYGLIRITEGIGMLAYQAVLGKANFSDVTGPIGIAGLVGDASHFGFSALMTFTAFISLNLAVINMLPLPALDGGRLILVLIEAVIRRPLDHRYVSKINMVGFTLLILLMVVVTAHDIAKLF